MSSRVPALVHATTTFRLALLYLALFVGSVVVILLVVYRFTAGFMEEELSANVSLELSAMRERYDRVGMEGVIEVVRDRAAAPHGNGIYLLLGPNGTVAGNIASWPAVPPDAEGWMHFTVADSGGPNGRPVTARAVAYVFPGRYRLLVGRDMSDLDQLRDRMVASLGWIVVVTGVLGVMGGGLLSRGALRRLEAINRTTHRIIAGDLTGRVPVQSDGDADEIDVLARNLNLMLDRIETLMNGMRQVSESVAHDLRTPLSRIRARIELALRDPTASAADHADVLADTLEEVDRLLATFAALLSIAQAESGERRRDFRPVDVAAAARLAAELYEPLAEERGITFTTAIESVPAVSGNAPLMSQVVANLLDNAFKYTPEGGTVRLTVEPAESGGVVLSVLDSGPGIPEEDRRRVLDRFVRLDQSRATPGNGLGLSLVDAVARLHGATLTMGPGTTSGAGPGLRVGLILPPERTATRGADGGSGRSPAGRR